MDALFERREPSSVVEVNCFADTVCIHQAQIFDSLGGMTLMDMPEGEIAFSFAGEHICLEQQGMQVLGIFRGQLGVKAFDPSVYTRQLLNALKHLTEGTFQTHFKWQDAKRMTRWKVQGNQSVTSSGKRANEQTTAGTVGLDSFMQTVLFYYFSKNPSDTRKKTGWWVPVPD